jgi:Tol biopolymer transport system component
MPSPQRKRLDSWKAVAEHLGRNVRTVTRWAEQRNLPIHRVPGGKRHSVFAYSDEIDAWLLSQRSTTTEEPISAPVPEPRTANGGPNANALHGPAARIAKFAWIAVAIAALAGSTAWIAKTLVEGHHPAAADVPLQFVQLTDDGRSKNHFRTDGRMLYFDESEGDGLGAFSVPLSGGQPQDISVSVSNPVIQDVSRDGKQLLVTSAQGLEQGHQLWVVPSKGGTARQVGTLTCEEARWSPDNRRVACVNGTAILIADSDGTHVRILTSLTSTPFNVTWAPDGGSLIFVLSEFNDPARGSAWQVKTNSRSAPVALAWGKGCCVDWTWADGGKRFLYLRLDAKRHAVIDEMPAVNDSPDRVGERTEIPVNVGTVLGFRANDEKGLIYLLIEGPSRGEVLKVGPTQTAYQVILPGISANDISFSSDGRWIAYVSPSDETLWRSRSDGSDALQLTRAPLQAELPAWSPDDRTIAYIAKAPGEPWRIFLIGKDGAGQHEAVPGGHDNQGAPSWSPDGNGLVYGNVLCQSTQTCWIHELDLRAGAVTILPGSHGLRTARFSPNGQYVAALQPEKHEIVLFDVKKRTWRTLVGSVTGDNVNWSRDSRFVFADSPRTDRPVIERIRVADGHRETVVELTPLERMPGLGSPWFGLAPDGSPILLHLYNSVEIYALNWNFH